jgi:hypothetical protein
LNLIEVLLLYTPLVQFLLLYGVLYRHELSRLAHPIGMETILDGHAGNIESTYSVNKKLPQEVIETMGQAHAQAAEKHLVTISQPTIG